MEVVEYSAIPPTPWRNGRGITRNLFDDATDAGTWTWRVSIAEITGTQPYSPYPGVRRGQVALGPGAVDLRIDGREVLLDPEGIVVFDGEAAVSASPREAGRPLARLDAVKLETSASADFRGRFVVARIAARPHPRS